MKTIQFKRGTFANIPSLQDGEPGWCEDSKKLYIGYNGADYPAVPDTTLAGLGLGADLLTFSVPANTTISAYGKTLIGSADASTARTNLDVARTVFGLSIMQAANAAAARALLGVVSGEVKSVKYYGAVGDGSTDDSGAFQDAHDDLPTSGGLIYIPYSEDPYVIGTKLAFTKPVFVLGDGWGSMVQAQEGITAVFGIGAGADGSILYAFKIMGDKGATGGTLQRGVEIDGAMDCIIKQLCFSGPDSTHGLNFGVDVIGQSSNRTKVLFSKFERMVSSSGNGTAILNEFSSYNQYIGNYITGAEFNNAYGSAGAAVFFSATYNGGGIGSTHNYAAHNRIYAHPQAGFAINSTTYNEFPGNLGECSENVIEANDVSYCNSSNGGAASSAVAIVGNSPGNEIRFNRFHYNGSSAGGFGISVSGSKHTVDDNGYPKIDESPSFTVIEGNRIRYNKDDGINVNGALYPIIVNNRCYENGQRTANTFDNIALTYVGASMDCSDAWIMGNHCVGSQPKYQIHIGANVNNAQVIHNYTPAGGTGAVQDDGTGTDVHP
jgi:parallel beta-helix repeat protein